MRQRPIMNLRFIVETTVHRTTLAISDVEVFVGLVPQLRCVSVLPFLRGQLLHAHALVVSLLSAEACIQKPQRQVQHRFSLRVHAPSVQLVHSEKVEKYFFFDMRYFTRKAIALRIKPGSLISAATAALQPPACVEVPASVRNCVLRPQLRAWCRVLSSSIAFGREV